MIVLNSQDPQLLSKLFKAASFGFMAPSTIESTLEVQIQDEPQFTTQFKAGAEFDANLKEPEKSFLEEVKESLEGLVGIVDASLRPLPTQTGNGTYLEDIPHGHLLKDLSNLQFRDFLTLGDLVKGKISTEPTDDKDYLMERVIKVCGAAVRSRHSANVIR